ncbi:hypothetical protein [Roseateles sp.]|uniref:hypothetical protein n=1 Tax=Roseateles sp. TaxID=1971397 RepID=UPI0039E92A7C
MLNTIKADEIAQLRCSQIGSPELVAFAQRLDVQPSTRCNCMSHLGAVFSVARPAWGYALDQQAMADAAVMLKKQSLVARSNECTRRPTLVELEKLLAHYEVAELKRTDSPSMRRLILFAVFSTRRQEEICTVLGADLDRDQLKLVVRDMKNPGEEVGNDVKTKLTPEALQLIDIQHAGKGRIWPHNHKSVSTSFTRACKILEIDDLHFHDLRQTISTPLSSPSG